MAPDPLASLDELEQSLDGCLRVDRFRLKRKIQSLRKKSSRRSNKRRRKATATTRPESSDAAAATPTKDGGKSSGEPGGFPPKVDQDSVDRIRRRIAESCRVRNLRKNQSLKVEYPPELPVSQRIDQIRELIVNNPVIVVCGETGSGKSTQLPKLCLELGRGVDGSIAHTQPRRLAARALANRVADELHSSIGDVVGYRVRFDQQLRAESRLQFVTDGLLLAELENDRFLDAYDTIIIDEAHERSLNIDLLLGHLKGLIKRRPDLRVIITSATIDPDRFSRFFDDATIIEVSGRTYPVDVIYQPVLDDKGREISLDGGSPDILNEPIVSALEDAFKHGDGDALVFLPGEREIRLLCEAAAKKFRGQAEVLPLFARLERADQDRVFKPGAKRRIVVATNVAETSVTVPRIRYVIDAGYARINRYSPGRRIARLALEKISQAAAEQRKGRSGRVRAGICYRLYSEDDFEARDEFTDPEILRSSLADVILRLEVLGLGGVEDFPFLDPPEPRRISDGFRLLEELGALDSERHITSIGRKLSRMPVDVRLGRMLIAAQQQQCVSEMITLTAALSIPDPRIVPAERMQQARERHREIENPESDFLTLLDLDRQWSAITGDRVTSRRARFCRDNFLSFLRMLEWTDLKRSLSRFVRDSKMTLNREPASSQSIHRAVLAGLLANVSHHDSDGIYLGTHGKKLKVHPSSALARKRKGWLVAAELTETQALYARIVAPVQPKWIEQTATVQLRKSHANPRWDRRRGSVYADERVTLYGLTLVQRRPVPFAKIDPVAARQVFINEALVAGRFDCEDEWYRSNQQVLADAEVMEARFRRRDLRLSDERLYDFYDAALADSVNGRDSFNHWWRKRSSTDAALLRLSPEQACDLAGLDLAQRPLQLESSGLTVQLSYRFEPGHELDGISALLPLSLLNQVDPSRFDWLVPGMLREKLIALCRTLPKRTRTQLVPIPDTIDQVLESLDFAEGELLARLSQALVDVKGVHVAAEQWQPQALESIHRMNYIVLDERGEQIASSRDLTELRQRFGAQARGHFVASGDWEIERTGIRKWDFGDLPERVQKTVQGQPIVGFPALVDAGSTCSIKVFDSLPEAQEAMVRGVRNLLLLQMPAAKRQMSRQMPDIDEMCLLFMPLGPCAALREQLIRATVQRAIGDGDLGTRDSAAFAAMAQQLKRDLMPALTRLCEQVLDILRLWRDIRLQLDELSRHLPEQTRTDVEQQLERLLPTQFVLATPVAWLDELPRILNGIKLRLRSAAADPRRDLARQQQLADCDQSLAKYRGLGLPESDLVEMQWWFEELRVSTYAQSLGTTMPISAKRLDREWQRRVSLLTGPG